MNLPKPEPFPEWHRLTILFFAGSIVAYSLFSIYSAATTWTSLPSSPVAILYFTVVLLAVPVFALQAFVLSWQSRRAGTATALTAIAAVILLVRAFVFGGL